MSISSAHLPPKLKNYANFDYTHFLFFFSYKNKILIYKEFSNENYNHSSWSEGTLSVWSGYPYFSPCLSLLFDILTKASLTSSLTFS